MSKQEFIKTFLPNTVEDITFVQINLDITDLSLADILRNIDTHFPKNSRTRNSLASGNSAVGILCKTELLDPLSGLLLIVTGGDVNIELVSRNYIVISVQEDQITNDDDIKHIIDKITKYMISSFKDSFEKFNDFYVKYIYDEYEMEQNQEDSEGPYNEYFN
jgi:hypothetical protein